MITLWKCATRNRLLCSTKSAGGTASSTPVMPPMMNVTMKPIDHNSGAWNRTRPPYNENTKWKTLPPGGTGDNQGPDAEDRVDVGAGAHGEEMMQPHHERKDADR